MAVKDEYTSDFAELLPEYSEYKLEMQLYPTVLNEQVKLSDENLFNGIIICKSKDKAYVEYALKQFHVPIGVAPYQLSSSMLEDMKSLLPDLEEIVKMLSVFEKNGR